MPVYLRLKINFLSWIACKNEFSFYKNDFQHLFGQDKYFSHKKSVKNIVVIPATFLTPIHFICSYPYQGLSNYLLLQSKLNRGQNYIPLHNLQMRNQQLVHLPLHH